MAKEISMNDQTRYRHLRLVRPGAPQDNAASEPLSIRGHLAAIREDLAWLRADAEQKNIMLKAFGYDLQRILSILTRRAPPR